MDLPDNVSATAVSRLVDVPGTSRATLTVLLTPEEVDKATKQTADSDHQGDSCFV